MLGLWRLQHLTGWPSVRRDSITLSPEAAGHSPLQQVIGIDDIHSLCIFKRTELLPQGVSSIRGRGA